MHASIATITSDHTSVGANAENLIGMPFIPRKNYHSFRRLLRILFAAMPVSISMNILTEYSLFLSSRRTYQNIETLRRHCRPSVDRELPCEVW
jgi:hypothetical protein